MIDWKRYEYFTEDEFKCHCCGICNVSPEFLEKLTEAREIAGIPFDINSGCRCKKHNKDEGGNIYSQHLTSKLTECSAADIKCNTDRKRFIIVEALIDAGFTHLGISKKDLFIHVDLDSRKAIWLY